MTNPSPIGYLVPEFPSQTHAFFWRELTAIESTGVGVHVFSTRRPKRGSCPHAFAETAISRTTYLFPPNWGRVLVFLARKPVAVGKALKYIGRLKETPPYRRAMLTALIGSAADLVIACRAAGIAHVHIHSCANAAHLGALANILGGLSYSLTLHGDLEVYGSDHRAKMANARFVSSVTVPLQASLKEKVNPDGHYPVIWMGVDTGRFVPNTTKRRSLQDGRFTAVSVARLSFTKGHHFFLQAMAQLRDEGLNIHYLIAGEGAQREAIEAEIDRLGLTEHVEMLGSVGEDQVLELLQSADMLALTSVFHGEAAPVAVMEAMSCALPPVCSIIGGTADMIEDGVDGYLVPQEDVSAIADATRKLVLDPVLRDAMGARARQTALKLFDHKTNAMALYNEIVAAGSR
jgi:glycosyltransferase involved in cell wall biosynthesis